MGKIVYALFVLFLIQALGFIYLGVEFPGSSLYQGVTGGYVLPFMEYIDEALVLLGGAAIIAGLYFIKSDFVFYAGISVVIYSFGKSYFALYNQVASRFGFIPPQILILFFVPLILPWVFIVLDWVRGRD